MTGMPRPRPKLLVLTIDCPPDVGGIQRIIHELGHRLSPRWDVTVVAPHAQGSRDYDEGVPFRVIRTRSTWQGSRLKMLAEMASIARRSVADVLLAAHLNVLAPVAAAGRGRRAVAMVYGSELWARRTRLAARAFGRSLDCVAAISRFTAAEAAAAGIPRGRIRVTPLGAELPAPSPDGERLLRQLGIMRGDEPLPFFLTVARLWEPHKGQELVIRAMPELLRRDPDVRYVIAGEGPLRQTLGTLAEDLGVAHAVLLPGAVDEAAKGALLRACRAFVMVSRELRRPPLFEGFGIVYVEAALAGRPSLGGRSGGTPDAVLDGQTGLLVDPSSVTEVREAARRLLEEPEYADQLGRRARERARAELTWEHAVARIEGCMDPVSP